MNDTSVLALSSIVNVVLAGFVLTRNPKGLINRVFATFSLSLVVWTIFNFLADQATANNLAYTRLTFASAVLICISGYELSNYFPSGTAMNRSWVRKMEWILASGAFTLSFLPLLIPSVNKIPAGVELEIGPLYGLYVAYILQGIVIIFYNLRKRISRVGVREKNQIRLLLVGIILYAILAGGSNLLLPLFIDSWSSSRYGPLFTLLFVAFTTYAIIKHRLLDIKLIAARSLAYLLLLSVLASAYSLVVFYLAENLFSENELVADRIIPIITVLFLAFTTTNLKQKFDNWTGRLFYRDAYDPQEFINQLNQVLVSTIDLEKLLELSSQVIQQTLKPEYCVFALKETSSSEARVIGTANKKFSKDDVGYVRSITPSIGRKVIIADDLEDSNSKLRVKMTKNDVAILVRLIEMVDTEKEGLGYIVLGPKKSGNLYNSQDVKMLEIIANEMVIATQNAIRFEEIQNFNVKLQEEVKRATGQLQRTNAKLVALDETKDDFISMASHQLRTPLTSVKGYLSMVLEGDAGKVNPKQVKLLTQAFTSSQRMVYLIADLLNVSRLRTGKFVIEPKPTNLAEVIEGEVGQLVETAQARGLKLSYEKPIDFPTLMLDETKIRQVIMNFTDNAIYYTRDGGNITVKLEETPQSVHFTVTDNGIGVPKHEQHHLFTKFYRAGNARKARPDGTGLGLFMAKKVVIAQGGSIIFKSQESKGSTFGFTFAKNRLRVPESTTK